MTHSPRRIAHAAAESDANEPGFVHAVALASQTGARLTSIHACAAGAPPVDLPHASTLLTRWGLLEERAPHDRVQHSCCESVDETLLDALHRLMPDLVIASTHARSGIARLLLGSVAEGVARNLKVPTLLLPLGGRQIVEAQTGAVRLERMLLPAGNARDAQRAVDAAVAFARMAGYERAELVLLHVADGTPWPNPQAPAGFELKRCDGDGPLERAIARAAEERNPDVLVMVTRGHDGPADVLLSSHTERVLHTCRRPLLWVPAQ
jgi:nucleotide-binding universal stress UspA family protein